MSSSGLLHDRTKDDSQLLETVPNKICNRILQTKSKYEISWMKRNYMAQKTKNKHFRTNMGNWKNILFYKEIVYCDWDTKAVYRHRKREIKRTNQRTELYFHISLLLLQHNFCVEFLAFFQSISFDVYVQSRVAFKDLNYMGHMFVC